MNEGQRSGRWVLPRPGLQASLGPAQVSWQGGRITGVTPLAALPPGPRRLLMPALANAHDHARTFRSSTLGTVGGAAAGALIGRDRHRVADDDAVVELGEAEVGVEAVESLTARGKRALAEALADQKAALGYEEG